MISKIVSCISNSFIGSLIISAFDGIGTLIFDKILSQFKKEKKTKKISETPTVPVLKIPSQLQKDIQTIENSIKHDISHDQKNVYLRFFNKYKSHFSSDDIILLNKKSSEICPNYGNLLSELLGLIESIQE